MFIYNDIIKSFLRVMLLKENSKLLGLLKIEFCEKLSMYYLNYWVVFVF